MASDSRLLDRHEALRRLVLDRNFTMADCSVYVVIETHANRKHEFESRVVVETIQRITGLSRKSVSRSISALARGDYLHVIPQGRENVYYLVLERAIGAENVPYTCAKNVPHAAEIGDIPVSDMGQTEAETCAKNVPPIKQLSKSNSVRATQAAEQLFANRFEEFWKAYPRKVNKKGAEKVWRSKKLEAIAKTILADVVARVADSGQWTDPKYIPHPTTYLNGARWEDEWTPSVQMAPLGTLPRETNADAINAASMRRLGITR